MPRSKNRPSEPQGGKPTADPIIAGLLGRLPKAGAVWPQADQAAWIAMLQTAFRVLYKERADQAQHQPPKAVA
jgi:hypothetical protein